MNTLPILPRASLALLLFGSIPAACLSASTAGASNPAALEPTDEEGGRPARVSFAEEMAVVPMALYGGKPVVEVRIGGRGPFRMYVDTGAGATVLEADFARELALPELGKTKIGDPSDPEGIEAERHQVDRLEVGGATFHTFEVVAFPHAGIYAEGSPRGVLGMPLFREILLTLDYPALELRLERGALPAADGREVVDYRPTESDLLGVPVTLAGVERLLTLDTGSPISLSFPEEERATLPLVAAAREVGRARTVGGEAIIYAAQLAGTFELGAIRIEKPDIHFFGRLTHGNLGGRFLSGYALSIDQANRRLRFRPGPAPAAASSNESATAHGTEATGAIHATDAARLAAFAGSYGERELTFADGRLHLQRLSGPRGAGPRVTLVEVAPLRFAIEAMGAGEVLVELHPAEVQGEEPELRVKGPAGEWESAHRSGS